MRQRLQIAMTVSGAVLAVALGQSLPYVFSDRMPQVAGEDVLALVLGDARLVFSNAMLDKAEEYLHGGVRGVACEHGLEGGSEQHEHNADGHDEDAAHVSGGTDLWSKLNGCVHVQEHRHPKGQESRELLPWLWVACRSAPQNIQAYENAAYVLASLMKRPNEAALLLEEGVRKNPASASLEFSLGKLFWHELHDPARAERALSAAREKCHPAAGPEGAEDRSLKGNVLFYLGFLAKQRGDLERARAYLAEVEALDPSHVGTRDLRKLLKSE